jgi:hypothetical protein
VGLKRSQELVSVVGEFELTAELALADLTGFFSLAILLCAIMTPVVATLQPDEPALQMGAPRTAA